MKRNRLAHISPWLLAAACALLAVIIAVFAGSNYRREKELMRESLIRQGLTVARFIAANSRASLRGPLRWNDSRPQHWAEHVQLVLDNSLDQPEIVGAHLFDREGTILAATESSEVGEKVEAVMLDLIEPLTARLPSGVSYVDRLVGRGEAEVFQLATVFHPLGRGGRFFGAPEAGDPAPGAMAEEDRRGWRRQGRRGPIQVQLPDGPLFLVVELDSREFSQSVQRQLIQIVTLSLVLLLVGTGGWLSLLTLQGLRGSQRRLLRIRRFTDILVSSLPVGVIATDAEGKIQICNETAEEMIGIPVAAVQGKAPAEVLPAELARLEDDSGGPASGRQDEVILHRGEEAERSLLLRVYPVRDADGRYAGSTFLIQDLSEIKQLQLELRKSERLAALGKMAAGIAHELRNPLSSIKGLALLLKAKVQQDSKGVETADFLVQEVERLNRSIGELLDYARPHRLRQEKLAVAPLLDKAAALLEADVCGSDVRISREYDGSATVFADPDKLTQVFLNLLLNALQSMPGGGRLYLRIRLQGESVVCEIEDTGCGVEEGSAERVFDPYFTTKSSGTGLGLAMSAKIVEEHRGTIDLRSRVGRGTVVRVRLPRYSGGS